MSSPDLWKVMSGVVFYRSSLYRTLFWAEHLVLIKMYLILFAMCLGLWEMYLILVATCLGLQETVILHFLHFGQHIGQFHIFNFFDNSTIRRIIFLIYTIIKPYSHHCCNYLEYTGLSKISKNIIIFLEIDILTNTNNKR